MKKFLNWCKSPKSDFVLFILLLLLANIAGNSFYKRWDLTQPKSYSLTQASIDLVKNIDEPLDVRVFFDKKLPSPYNSIAQYVEDLLEEYKHASNKNFTISFMDVSKEENAELADEFGLRKVQIQEVKNNEVGFKQSYMGIVISYGGSIALIDPITTADGFEFKFTSTLSKMISTADALAGLKEGETLKMTLYMSKDLKDMGIEGIKEAEQLIKSAYEKVNKNCQGRIVYETVSPENSAKAVELAEHYGLLCIPYTTQRNTREAALFGLVIETQNSTKEDFYVVPVTIIQQNMFVPPEVTGLETLETDIEECIQALISSPAQIGYVMDHQELPLQGEQYAENFDAAVSKSYQFRELRLTEEEIPAGIKTVVINGPQIDFEEEELYAIDQFLMRGGNLMILVDGMNTAGQNGYSYGGPQYQFNQLNLDKLLNKYGVQRGYNMVMDKNCFVNYSAQGGKIEFYWAPVLQKDLLAENHPITKNLGYVTMLENGSLDVSAAEANPDVDVTILARSSNDSWCTTNQNMMLYPGMVAPPADAEYKSEILAVLLEGNFESAFDEPPATEDEEGNVVEADEYSKSAHIAKSKLPGKIFIASSSYLTTYQVFNADASSPTAMMIMNAVDYLNGNEDLCVMRTKGLSLNTLTVKSQKFAKFVQYFNEFGLAVIVALVGLLIWRLRAKRKIRINKKYNPDDTRTITKEKNTVKDSEEVKNQSENAAAENSEVE